MNGQEKAAQIFSAIKEKYRASEREQSQNSSLEDRPQTKETPGRERIIVIKESVLKRELAKRDRLVSRMTARQIQRQNEASEPILLPRIPRIEDEEDEDVPHLTIPRQRGFARYDAKRRNQARVRNANRLFIGDNLF